jgi:phosphoglycolate phosphatase
VTARDGRDKELQVANFRFQIEKPVSQSEISNLKSSIPKRLLLFDIDGTLIDSGGAGIQSLKDVLEEQFGISDDLRGVEIAGQTDTGIVHQILRKQNIAVSNETTAAFLERYLEFLARELPQRNGTILPGVQELLLRLRARPQNVLGLLTGNVERGAKLKLSHYGIWDFFEFGAFADDHHDRNELGPFAQGRAREKHAIDFAAADIDVIGDTPHDIACGKVIGARTIAVATGSFSREQLAEHQPDRIVDDFSAVDAVIAGLGW